MTSRSSRLSSVPKLPPCIKYQHDNNLTAQTQYQSARRHSARFPHNDLLARHRYRQVVENACDVALLHGLSRGVENTIVGVNNRAARSLHKRSQVMSRATEDVIELVRKVRCGNGVVRRLAGVRGGLLCRLRLIAAGESRR